MLSVALSEAFSCRSQSALVAAEQHASVAADLAGGLAANLSKALQYLHGFACALSGLPSGNPLNPEFYRSETARHAAEWHSVRHGILLRDRSRFLHKLGTLARITQSVAHEFDEQLATSPTVHPLSQTLPGPPSTTSTMISIPVFAKP